ncbi:hypothetical protein Lal_00015420 [Lupinus albus]|nr:hypothetical protein Lal_00015420 [Lupinus albus]
MSVGEYTAKFEELARFYPYMELEMDGRSKCSKFESGLKPKLRRMFGHQEIADFPTLVNKCRMYEDDLTVDVVVTPRANPPKNFGPQRNNPKATLWEYMPGVGNRMLKLQGAGAHQKVLPKTESTIECRSN